MMVTHKYLATDYELIRMKYRSRTEIAAQILDVAREGTTKTRIMYRAFLSYAQLKEYLTVLIKNDLLNLDPKDQSYKTTEKGQQFLRIYSHMGDLVASSLQTEPPKPRLK